jgi:hypothetical protein
VQWFLKQHDVAVDFQKRFATLVESINKDVQEALHAPEGVPGADELRQLAEQSYLRFWTLQEEQFQIWMDRLIPDITYRCWMRYRAYESRSNFRFIKGLTITYLEGWRAVRGNFRDSLFVTFMDTLLQSDVQSDDAAEAAFQQVASARRSQGRRFFSFKV